MRRRFSSLLLLAQAILAIRVVWRLVRSGGDTPIAAAREGTIQSHSVSIIVPVLNEAHRVAACLEGCLQQGPEVAEILVVDSDSTDETCMVVHRYTTRDPRVRFVQAGPAPTDWNGKVWGLRHGECAVAPRSTWVLTLDADVAPAPALARSLVSHALARGSRMLSVATHQHLADAALAVVHPAMLATLVYRFGRPGGSTSDSSVVMANGQCCLIERDLLRRLGGFRSVRGSLCEDVSLARLAAHAGVQVGFYEAPELIDVSMYVDWRDAWRNWPRSLATRDAQYGVHGWLGLLEVLLVQALPLPAVLFARPGMFCRINLLLLAMRFGVLAGMARAYVQHPWTYWLSPLVDFPVALALFRSALVADHVWRGRSYVRQKGSIVPA